MNERIALIIANSEYNDAGLPRLETPVNDARALANVLRDPELGDFEVTLLIDKTEGVIRKEIAKLYDRRVHSDLLLLYYSGHGIRDAYGDLYLATRDTDVDLTNATALSAAFVRDQIDKSGSQRKVVILDCCNSGAFAGTKAALGGSVGTQQVFAGNGYGRIILTASDALEYAWEGKQWRGKKKLSVFTHFIVEGLRTGKADLDGDGEVSLDELYDYVHKQVLISGYAKQTPHKWSLEVDGQITIAHAPVKAEEPAPSPAPELPSIPTPVPISSPEPASAPELPLVQQTVPTPVPISSSKPASMPQPVPVLSTETPSVPNPISSPAEGLHPWQRTSDLLKRVPKWAWWFIGGMVAVGAMIIWGPENGGLPLPLFATATPTELPPTPTSTPTNTPTPTPTQTGTPTPTPSHVLGDTWNRPKDNMVMVYVPAGEFEMGSTDEELEAAEQKGGYDTHQNSQPIHTVALDSFWIDQTEVSHEQYALCVANGTCEESGQADDYKFGNAKQPVVGVSWTDALTYCRWAGSRLPTEAEWEYAARGPQSNLYPWGNDSPTCRLAKTSGCGTPYTAPVGSTPGDVSWCGALDMAGNVEEWVNDWYDEDYYENAPHKNPAGPSKGDYKVARGGKFIGVAIVNSSLRWPREPEDAYIRSHIDVGFRCVRRNLE